MTTPMASETEDHLCIGVVFVPYLQK